MAPKPTRSLSEYLKTAGLVAPAAAPAAAEPVKAAAAAPAAPAKTAAPAPEKAAAAIAPNQPSAGEASGGHKPREKATETNAADTGAPKAAAVEKTAAQKWLLERGVDVADSKLAEQMFAREQKLAQLQKRAAIEKQAEEQRALGAIFYQGMTKESTALRLAFEQATFEDAQKIAAALQIPVEGIIKRAEEMRAAMGSPALVGTNLGSAARVSNSEVMRVADQNDNTSETRSVEAIGGTRQPTSGDGDPNLKRMVDIWTLPGNPGLNHGQAVDQGKARA